MIHYHGAPMRSSNYDVARFYARRHAMVSFAMMDTGRADQLPLIAEVAQSFVLDNGAFSVWKAGRESDSWRDFYDWAARWLAHPGCDWALIPDVIRGDEAANDALLVEWPFGARGVPVWHLHESIERLERLASEWPRVALGSSGAYATVGASPWWDRIAEALDAICDEEGVPRTKLHGLRMLDPEIFSEIPFASADSTNVVRNVRLDSRWSGTYAPKSAETRALVIADRIEVCNSPARWIRPARQMAIAGSPLFGGC